MKNDIPSKHFWWINLILFAIILGLAWLCLYKLGEIETPPEISIERGYEPSYVVSRLIPPKERLEIPVILEKIAFCESRTGQFDKDGNVVRGKVNPKDVGKFQINEYYWLEKSIELGYNIYTEKGNIKMALWIYESRGLSPWNASKPCWGKYLTF